MIPVNAITTHNVLGEVEPIYVSFDGEKHKITKILSIEKNKEFNMFWCYFEDDDRLIHLCFDGAKWWIE